MSKLIILAMFLMISTPLLGQKTTVKIDQINSISDVEELLQSIDQKYKKFRVKPITDTADEFCKKTADSLRITNAFYKADFDNNGHTDLLAIGDYYGFTIFAVMNFGNDSLKVINLTRRHFEDCTFPKIIDDTIIRYYYKPEPLNYFVIRHRSPRATALHNTKLQYKDLIFKYGDFIEYNTRPVEHKIEKIQYQTTTCYGFCPEFHLSINQDRSATFNAQNYNRKDQNSSEINGIFETTLDENSYNEILSLLNYIDFPHLEEDYDVSWTDDQTSYLKVTYDGGKVKVIRDYGLIGTFGLNRLYSLLFDLRFNQNWKSKDDGRYKNKIKMHF